MGSVSKHTHKATANILRHNAREINNPANKDIDSARSHLNSNLTPMRASMTDNKFRIFTPYAYYKKRLSELYIYARSDVKTLCSWVCTAPRDLQEDQEERFFLETFKFVVQRYGEINIVQAIVHRDESRQGRNHLHICFIPAVPDKKHGGEKVCANDVLTKRELQTFHPAWQAHLTEAGIDARVISGVTKLNGGNRTVKQLKNRELERSREIERGIFR